MPAGILTIPMALLIGASIALAFRGLFISYSYWFDKLISVVGIPQRLPEMFALILTAVHPPLYYLLLHYWTHTFDTGEIAAFYMPPTGKYASSPRGASVR